MSPSNNPEWDTRDFNSYQAYLEITSDLKTKGFEYYKGPLPLGQTKELQELVNQEHEVIRVSHFDDGRRVKDMFETYVRFKSK